MVKKVDFNDLLLLLYEVGDTIIKMIKNLEIFQW